MFWTFVTFNRFSMLRRQETRLIENKFRVNIKNYLIIILLILTVYFTVYM